MNSSSEVKLNFPTLTIKNDFENFKTKDKELFNSICDGATNFLYLSEKPKVSHRNRLIAIMEMEMWIWKVPNLRPGNKKNICEKQNERRIDELGNLGASLPGKRKVEGEWGFCHH